jgi:hypothetical protein
MDRIRVKAGKRAYEIIQDGGFTFDRIATYVGPAVGPRWLVASGFDLALMEGGKLGSRSKPALLAGASAGAWRFAPWLQPEPIKSYLSLIDAYIKIPFTRSSTPLTIKNSLTKVVNSFIEDDALPFALANEQYRLAITTVRVKNLMASEGKFLQKTGLGLASLFNAISPSNLRFFFERVVFYSGPRPPLFCLRKDFKGRTIPLSLINFKHVLLASGAIPGVIAGITDIYGAPTGIYRDGGLMDYHINQEYAARDEEVILLFHHQEKLIPGWLDKKLKNRQPPETFLDHVLMIYPSENLIQRFPGEKVPDRDDFTLFLNDPEKRMENWRRVVDLSAPLGEIFIDLVESGRIRKIVEKL